MGKKLILGGVVLLLLAGGGIFLFVKNKKASEYISTPTTWSQAGDYETEQVGGQTVVTNKKAGFSFKIPDGWRVKSDEGVRKDEYFLTFLSPDAEFQKDRNGVQSPFLAKGCGISIDTLYQEIEFDNLNARIISTKEKPVNTSSRKEQILQIASRPALEVVFESNDPRFVEKFGKITQVSIPFRKNGVIEIGSSIMSVHESKCDDEFSDFLSSFSIVK